MRRVCRSRSRSRRTPAAAWFSIGHKRHPPNTHWSPSAALRGGAGDGSGPGTPGPCRVDRAGRSAQCIDQAVFETVLDEEMSEYLGYDNLVPVGRNRGNSRNGDRWVAPSSWCGEIWPRRWGHVQVRSWRRSRAVAQGSTGVHRPGRVEQIGEAVAPATATDHRSRDGPRGLSRGACPDPLFR